MVRNGQYCGGQDPDGRVPEEQAAQRDRPALGVAQGNAIQLQPGQQVNHQTRPYIQRMMVDEKQKTPLSNYNGLNRGNKVTESDHNKLELFLKIETPQIKPQRKEFFFLQICFGTEKIS